MSSRLLAAALLLLASVLQAACRSSAEMYPSRPILLVCPWAVGGGTDRLSRQVAAFLESELGVPVNVVNAPGGGGVTGHSRGARARPDGYTVTMMTLEIATLHWRGLTAISWRDFEPVMLVNRDPAAVFVRSDDRRFERLDDLLAAVRERPGRVTASGTAGGGIWHLALAGALDKAGIDPAGIRWIPTEGAGPALQELLSGGVDIVACSLPEARSFLSANRIRSLGVMAGSRVPAFGDVPTFREQGLDWIMGTWRGLGLPAGTPAAVRDRLVAALTRIVRGETVLNGQTLPQLMAREGLLLQPEAPAAFQATLADTDATLGALLTSPAFASVAGNRVDPMAYPRLLFAALAVIVAGLVAARVGRSRTVVTGPTRTAIDRGGLLRIAEVIAAVVVYTLLAEPLGFLVTMSVLVFLLLWRLGTKVVTSAVVTLAVVPAVYALFATLLRVPLPVGLLGW